MKENYKGIILTYWVVVRDFSSIVSKQLSIFSCKNWTLNENNYLVRDFILTEKVDIDIR